MLNNQIQKLQQDFNLIQKKQQKLEEDILDCTKKLVRASTLIVSLGGEQVRWQSNTEKLTEQLKFVLGDILLSAGVISYLGPFSSIYRSQQINKWQSESQKKEVLVSENYSMEQTLGEAI